MKHKGFTLIEVTITLTLVAILLLTATASWQYFHQKNALISIKDQIITAIHYAKTIAYSHNKSVYISHLDKEKSWDNGIGLYDAKHQLLYQWKWNKPAIKVYWKGFESEEYLHIAAHPLHAGSNGKVIIENTMTHEKIMLMINRMARVVEIDDASLIRATNTIY